MENALGIRFSPDADNQDQLVGTSDKATARATKRPLALDWYPILRVHYHWRLLASSCSNGFVQP